MRKQDSRRGLLARTRSGLALCAALSAALEIPEDIPFSETRAFVTRVLDATPIYRRSYAERLALLPPVGALP